MGAGGAGGAGDVAVLRLAVAADAAGVLAVGTVDNTSIVAVEDSGVAVADKAAHPVVLARVAGTGGN